VRVTVLPYVSRIRVAVNAWLLARRIRKLTNGLPVVLHCRGEAAVEWAAALAPRLGHAAILADIRGIWPDEMLLARGYEQLSQADDKSRRDHQVAMDHLKNALRRAHAVIAVSDALAGWVEDLGVWRGEIGRVPCCVSRVRFSQAERDARRAALGVSDRIVLSYLGGIASYQHIEDGLAPFVRLARQLNDRIHLLCITKDPERMRTLLHAGGIPAECTTVIRVPQAHVPDHLCVADAGLLLRAASDVNRVSMPVKVGEYLSCGVPLIVSRFSGWVDELVGSREAGIVIDWFGMDPSIQAREVARVIEAVERHGTRLREGALALCADRFLWSGYTGELRRAYVRALAVAEGG
jgi:glycosyltransferase involved in cell wall biosynthesis